MVVFLQFLIGHALGDFVLQGETMARAKSRHYVGSATRSESFPPWYYWLLAHGLVHGGIVWFVSGSWALAMIETALHTTIDWAKCEHKITFHQDQALHLLCKAAYCSFL